MNKIPGGDAEIRRLIEIVHSTPSLWDKSASGFAKSLADKTKIWEDVAETLDIGVR
uniref:MADF domain-containing protein n=1 Tax=Plectus sambesii TaxID=2011161 RepID=A0A914XC32_9BILA